WKVMSENNGECYHCPIAHPGLRQFFEGQELANTVSFEEYRAVGKVHFSPYVPRQKEVDAGMQMQGGTVGVNLFPSTHFGTMRIGDEHWMHVISWVAIAPNHTKQRVDYLLSSEPSDELRSYIPFTDQVVSEDISIAESAQRGMESGVFKY